MTNCVITLCTCGSREEAERLATILVEERLAACVNILPGVHSVYRWQGKIESASEHLVFIKTTEARQRGLERRIGELHSYDIPEVISMPIVSGSKKYLTWVADQVSRADGAEHPA
jgi:periplasmic divalent cation tolerance protein